LVARQAATISDVSVFLQMIRLPTYVGEHARRAASPGNFVFVDAVYPQVVDALLNLPSELPQVARHRTAESWRCPLHAPP
jgi:hypothetical protein